MKNAGVDLIGRVGRRRVVPYEHVRSVQIIGIRLALAAQPTRVGVEITESEVFREFDDLRGELSVFLPPFDWTDLEVVERRLHVPSPTQSVDDSTDAAASAKTHIQQPVRE